MFREEAKSRLLLTTPNGCDYVLGWEIDAQVICRWDDFHGVYALSSHDHVMDGGMVDHREVDDLCDFLGDDWQLDQSESH